MKKYITLFMIVAVAFLFMGQTDSLAKTAKQAVAQLSVDNDGLSYYKLKTPKIYQPKSTVAEDKDAHRFGGWFVTEIVSLQNRVSKIWDRVLPIIYKTFNKNIAVVD